MWETIDERAHFGEGWVFRFSKSWRLFIGRYYWCKRSDRGFRGWPFGLRFARYEPGGIDWRYWQFLLLGYTILVERPSSDRDKRSLDRILAFNSEHWRVSHGCSGSS